jgi:hypothetical protein
MAALVAFLDACGPPALQSKSQCMCRVCTIPLRMIMLLLAVILWIVAGLLLGLSTGMSDFCIDANTNIFNLVESGSASDTYLEFFVSWGAPRLSSNGQSVDPHYNCHRPSQIFCDVNPTVCSNNPFSQVFGDLETAFDGLKAELIQVEAAFNLNCPGPTQCDAVEPPLTVSRPLNCCPYSTSSQLNKLYRQLSRKLPTFITSCRSMCRGFLAALPLTKTTKPYLSRFVASRPAR